MQKSINKSTKKFRIALRCAAAISFVIPVAAYLTFAALSERITYIYNYETLEQTVIHDNYYLVASSALTIGNQTWPILLPLALALGAIDVGISLYRQIASS
jgi:uncharacterized membrane protein YccF (DUF307 family)